MNGINCNEEIYNIIQYIGVTHDLNIDPDMTEEQSSSENATAGVERILKYYLLNYVMRKWDLQELGIDPTLDVKQILDIVSKEQSKLMWEKVERILKQPLITWDEMGNLKEEE